MEADALPVNTYSHELSYLVGRKVNRRASAERPQLHGPGTAAAGRNLLSAARRRVGSRSRSRHQRQRRRIPDRTFTCWTGTPQNDFTNGPAGSAAGTALGWRPSASSAWRRTPTAPSSAAIGRPDYAFSPNPAPTLSRAAPSSSSATTTRRAELFRPGAKPEFTRNQFGGTARRTYRRRTATFFFVGYEGLRRAPRAGPLGSSCPT